MITAIYQTYLKPVMLCICCNSSLEITKLSTSFIPLNVSSNSVSSWLALSKALNFK